MFIETISTPNPNTLKFIPGCDVLPNDTRDYRNIENAKESPLAERLLEINGISGVFLSGDFIAVTKIDKEWNQLKPIILGEIMDHFLSNHPIIIEHGEKSKNITEEFFDKDDAEIVKTIKELIETRVRPAVAQDGGDITFQGYDNGTVYLNMQGACSGCPSSTMTLKNGIENLLKHYVPEIKEVEAL